jgi:hypothetical protein
MVELRPQSDGVSESTLHTDWFVALPRQTAVIAIRHVDTIGLGNLLIKCDNAPFE